jgi:hypothetical protein
MSQQGVTNAKVLRRFRCYKREGKLYLQLIEHYQKEFQELVELSKPQLDKLKSTKEFNNPPGIKAPKGLYKGGMMVNEWLALNGLGEQIQKRKFDINKVLQEFLDPLPELLRITDEVEKQMHQNYDSKGTVNVPIPISDEWNKLRIRLRDVHTNMLDLEVEIFLLGEEFALYQNKWHAA